MKLQGRLLVCFLIFVAFTVTVSACWQQSLLRYGNRASCVGVHGLHSAHLFASWHRINDADMLIFENTQRSRFPTQHWLQLQALNPETGEVEKDISFPVRSNIRDFTFFEAKDLIAITRDYGESAETSVYSLGTGEQLERIAVIERAVRVTWHPDELLLAAIHYPKGYDQGSNIIALFDVSGATPVLTREFELKDVAIAHNLGWSGDGQIIAVSLYDPVGEIPYYIFPENEVVVQSLFHRSRHNCVTDVRWAPDKQEIVFSGDNDALDGWDIFRESVAPAGSEGRSLVNLTNSAGEDEYGVSWSPDGKEIVYVKVYEESADDLRQELFILEVNGRFASPVQLTDTPGEFETNPLWIAKEKIAYLSWNPDGASWSLKTISLVGTGTEPETVLEIPREWYRLP